MGLPAYPCHQSRDIGTKIITEAEEIARALGHRQIALGVGVDNLRARRLYTRLGYRDWGHGPVDTSYQVHLDDGATKPFSETIHVMTKLLTTAQT